MLQRPLPLQPFPLITLSHLWANMSDVLALLLLQLFFLLFFCMCVCDVLHTRSCAFCMICCTLDCSHRRTPLHHWNTHPYTHTRTHTYTQVEARVLQKLLPLISGGFLFPSPLPVLCTPSPFAHSSSSLSARQRRKEGRVEVAISTDWPPLLCIFSHTYICIYTCYQFFFFCVIYIESIL